MSDTSGVGSTGQSSSSNSTSSSTTTNKMDTLDTSEFIKMMVAELQNQDPMNPMSNSELLQQVGQIRAIDSNDKLSTTLQSVVLGQNLATAGNMINQTVAGLSDDGNKIIGKVRMVSIDSGEAKLCVGDQTISLKNIAAVVPEGTTTEDYTNIDDTQGTGT